MDPGLSAVLFCVAIGALLLGLLFVGRRRAVEEQGLTPRYEATCSAFADWVGGTNIPSVRLSIYDSFVVVAWLSPRVIPLKDIEEARVSRFLFGRCVLIKPRRGMTLRLGVKEPERVVRLLKRA